MQDVVFVIDASGSIGTSYFQQIRELTANITTRVIHNSPQSTVGVILFSSTARIFQTYTTLNALLSAIDNLPYSGGGTNTAEALTLLLSSSQNGRLQLRHYSSKFAIIVTDGRSNSPSATSSAIAELHASKIFNIFAVGIDGSDLIELKRIASSPEFTFLTSSTIDLQQLQDRILLQLCIGMYVSSQN